MLFQSRFHPGIESGETTLTFRHWASARVKPGKRYRCPPIGILEVEAVEPVAAGRISEDEAARSGFQNRTSLLQFVARTSKTEIEPSTLLYRVRFRFVGPDETPSPVLPATLSAASIEALVDKLAAFDQRSRSGPWTDEALTLIGGQTRVAAARLCEKAGLDKAVFKAKVRKLKKLVLTVSFEVGYELTPGGRRVLESLRDRYGS